MPDELADQFGASVEEAVALYEEWAASGTYDQDVEDWGYDAPERGASMVIDALARCPAPLDLADGSFAATVSIGVFTYLADLDTALRELLRVVAPGYATLVKNS